MHYAELRSVAIPLFFRLPSSVFLLFPLAGAQFFSFDPPCPSDIPPYEQGGSALSRLLKDDNYRQLLFLHNLLIKCPELQTSTARTPLLPPLRDREGMGVDQKVIISPDGSLESRPGKGSGPVATIHPVPALWSDDFQFVRPLITEQSVSGPLAVTPTLFWHENFTIQSPV